MKKLRALALLPFLSLTSCAGQQGIVGTYSFMLGKAKDTHVRLAMELTNEDYKKEETVKGKKFVASLDTGSYIEITDEQIHEYFPEVDPQEIRNLVFELTGKTIDQLINEKLSDIQGYYEVNDKIVNEKYGYRLKLGTVLAGELEIPEKAIEQVLVAYINSSSVTLQIPVSVKDLQMQLCWYGTYVNFESKTDNYFVDLTKYGKLPGEEDAEKRVGTHPSVSYDKETGLPVKDEVVEMNVLFAGQFSNTIVYTTGETQTKIGTIFELDDTLYFEKTEDYQVTDANIDASLLFKRSYGVYDIATEVTMTVNRNKLVEKGYGEIVQVKTKLDSKDVESDQFLQDPFVFRDFHDIKMGLAREDK